MKQEKRQEVLSKSLQIKNLVQANFDQNMEHIQYYERIEFEGARLAEEQIYVVKLLEKQPSKNENSQTQNHDILYAIYDKNQNLIATVGENGIIEFTQEYKDKLKKMFPKFYHMLNLEGNELSLPQELAEDDMALTEDDLAEFEEEQKGEGTKKAGTQRETKNNKEQEKQDIEGETEEERKQQIAETLGIKPEDVKGFAQIDPNRKITEDHNLRDMIPETKGYARVEIACATGEQNQGDGRFCILGITKDGTREVLNFVQSIEGVATNKQVISINERGDEIKENSVQGLMRINARDREDGIAFSLGNYGMLDITYVRDVMNKESRRSTPIDTLEMENRKNLSPEVRENAADDIHEVREESKNFRRKQEQGKEIQDLEDIDKQRNDNIEVAKARIAEDATELINEGATKQQVTSFISQELDKIPSVSFNNQEKAYLISQIEAEALDLSRFPTRTPRN